MGVQIVGIWASKSFLREQREKPFLTVVCEVIPTSEMIPGREGGWTRWIISEELLSWCVLKCFN